MDQRIYNKYVVETLNNGSITKAAHTLQISQPALSNGITALEKKLGFKIFNRNTTPISLTPEGELYYNYIQQQLILEQDFFKKLDALHVNKNNSFIVGAPSAYIDTAIASAVYDLLHRHPNYEVTIKEAPLDELINLASHGEIHCFISTSENLPEHFEKKIIYYENICLGIPQNMLSDKEEIITCDFDAQNFIFLENWQPLQLEIMNYFEQNQLNPIPKITVKQVSTAITLAQKGLGICFASEDSLKKTNLKIYQLPIKPRPIYIAYHKELFIPKSALYFIKYLQNGGQT